MARYYGMTTSKDNGVDVERPILTADGRANLAEAMAELTADGIYDAEDHAGIYAAGLERYFRNSKAGRQAGWDKKHAALKTAGVPQTIIDTVLGKRPA